ncbi:hypothetical protein CAPTEDRAFT_228688 [Capitella teleta]|uniref:Tetraspanin n=1 Tax=Capitella teleta TaxID=283909 RepID=R7VES6_CAPTE|nr:hypothetical protein CAPTEDRAFT_228688 [Capitella teleta]|eukprot:ELU17087.1 hypothetical protein CAPTEDRAFT_228688 [Capitella teleta]
MTLLGMAIYLRMNPSVLNFIRAGFQDSLDSFFILCYILVGAGAVLTFIGFMGCCAAFLEFRCLVGSFFILLFMVFAIEVGIAVWIVMHKDGLNDQARSTFPSLVKQKYDEDRSVIQIAVDHVQTNLHCCGSAGPSDWFNSTWAINHGFVHSVPVSCCQQLSFPKGYDAGVCGRQKAQRRNSKPPEIFTEGCLSRLMKLYEERFFLVTHTSAAIIGVQLLSLISSLGMCCCMRRDSAGGYKA